MAAILKQIYFEDWQKNTCYPFADLHYNEGLTIFFENSVIKDVVLATKSEKIAVCSWQLREKLKWYIGTPRELTLEVLASDYDVLTMTRNTKYHKMLSAAALWHPGFLKTFDKMLSTIGVTRPHEVRMPIYQNHFSARTEIYQDYVKEYLSPAMAAIMSDKELYELATVDSGYSKLKRDNIVTAEYLMKKIGMPYFPLAPFLLERLFSIYIHNKRINVTYL